MSVATVVSIFPRQLTERKPSVEPNEYIIPACADELGRSYPDIPPVTVLIHDATTKFYKGFNEWIPAVILAEDLADDIVNAFFSSNIDVTPDPEFPIGPGLFFVVGAYDREDKIRKEGFDPEKSAKWIQSEYSTELKKTHKSQDQWFQLLVRRADSEWQRSRNSKSISDVHRFAAKRLGMDRDWARDITLEAINKCPACRQSIDPLAIICPVCKTVLNPAALAQLQGNTQDLFAKVG